MTVMLRSAMWLITQSPNILDLKIQKVKNKFKVNYDQRTEESTNKNLIENPL